MPRVSLSPAARTRRRASIREPQHEGERSPPQYQPKHAGQEQRLRPEERRDDHARDREHRHPSARGRLGLPPQRGAAQPGEAEGAEQRVEVPLEPAGVHLCGGAVPIPILRRVALVEPAGAPAAAAAGGGWRACARHSREGGGRGTLR
ncbi:hypothetical protein AB1Y20_012067 [Prymnesium parvum]|uniref:Uncharacterized protein n=1 Tax=Prymnesium parvum TaxID=97485 RepID=A0AB34IQ92_PRYPA